MVGEEDEEGDDGIALAGAAAAGYPGNMTGCCWFP